MQAAGDDAQPPTRTHGTCRQTWGPARTRVVVQEPGERAVVRPRPAPGPNRYSPCARCRAGYKPVEPWAERTVCQYGYLAAKRTRGTCPGCGHDCILPGRDSDRRLTCRPCRRVILNVGCRTVAELRRAELFHDRQSVERGT